MRRAHWVWLHRWAGLYMALFLVVAGLTGSVLAFAPELQGWLDPSPKIAVRSVPMLEAMDLRARAAALAGPGAMVNGVELHLAHDQPYTVWVEPASGATRAGGAAADGLGYDFIRLDPYTGEEIERGSMPSYGLWPITRHNLLNVIVALHYRLAIPGSIGGQMFGIAALIWTVDCFIALYLTFPAQIGTGKTLLKALASWPARWWNPSWQVKRRASFIRLNYDLHRAGGLWIWVLLLALAWSSVGFNLRESVYLPVMRTCFGYQDLIATLPNTPAPWSASRLGWDEALDRARLLMAERARRQDFTVLYEEALVYRQEKHVFQYWVRSDRDIIQPSVMTYLLIDANDGRDLGLQLPTGDRLGNTLNTWVAALHMAMVWGLPYKIFLAVSGIIIAMLSVTGVYIWWVKRRARLSTVA